MPLDTSYRSWTVADLAAMRLSIMTQLKAIEGTGQSHSLSGRNTSMADFRALTETLANVNAAIQFQAQNPGDAGGYARRFASFGGG